MKTDCSRSFREVLRLPPMKSNIKTRAWFMKQYWCVNAELRCAIPCKYTNAHTNVDVILGMPTWPNHNGHTLNNYSNSLDRCHITAHRCSRKATLAEKEKPDLWNLLEKHLERIYNLLPRNSHATFSDKGPDRVYNALGYSKNSERETGQGLLPILLEARTTYAGGSIVCQIRVT